MHKQKKRFPAPLLLPIMIGFVLCLCSCGEPASHEITKLGLNEDIDDSLTARLKEEIKNGELDDKQLDALEKLAFKRLGKNKRDLFEIFMFCLERDNDLDHDKSFLRLSIDYVNSNSVEAGYVLAEIDSRYSSISPKDIKIKKLLEQRPGNQLLIAIYQAFNDEQLKDLSTYKQLVLKRNDVPEEVKKIYRDWK